MDLLPQLNKDTGHAGILTDGHFEPLCPPVIFNDVVKHPCSGRPKLILLCGSKTPSHIVRQNPV